MKFHWPQLWQLGWPAGYLLLGQNRYRFCKVMSSCAVRVKVPSAGSARIFPFLLRVFFEHALSGRLRDDLTLAPRVIPRQRNNPDLSDA